MNELKFIPVKAISMLSNYRDVEPVSEKDPEIKELADSISKHGVMQPILVRSNRKPGHYELIFGHRRLVACKIAKIETIPANIKEVSDDDILEYQVTENLQRKDVHPMDEAVAFHSLILKKNYSIEEIAARFAKSKDFVTQRLKLIDLIPELKNDFKKGKMSFGHALSFCRLSAEDQKMTKNNARWGRDYGTLSQLNNYIENNIIRNLSSSPFKKDDADLVPAAGACKVCPKRSGFNKSLFGDIDKDDRCFDGKCFELKLSTFVSAKAKEIIETKPDIYLVCDDLKKVADVIKQMARDVGVRIIENGRDYSDWTYHGSKYTKKATGFFVQGYKLGQTITIYLEGAVVKGAGSSTATKEKEKSGKLTSDDIAEEIKRIQEREKRSKELDLNKVHKDTLDQVEKKKASILSMKHQPIDRGIMIYILLQEVSGFAVHDNFKGIIKGLPVEVSSTRKGYAEEYFKQLSKVNDDQLSALIRAIAFRKWLNKNFSSDVSTSDTGLRLIAAYAGIDLKAIEKQQQEISGKRNERIKKRISDLNSKKKELVGSKSKKK